MIASVLVIAWVLCVLIVAVERNRLQVGHNLREAMLVASALCSVLIVGFTELLSSMALLSFGPLLVCWLVTIGGLLAWVGWKRTNLHGWQPFQVTRDPWEWALTAIIGSLLAVTGVAAAWSPPNNYDSMLCHLPRQVRWIQQASVAHFPCEYVPQTAWPPFAEFAGVHLMILSGGDGWSNLVQWFALAMTVVAVSSIAHDLGLNRRGQLLAAVFVLTLPDALLQALNTKGDLVVSFWLCSAAWWCMRLWSGYPWNLGHSALLGASLGLLALTKGTGYLFALPVVALFGLGLLLKQRTWFLKTALTVGGTALLLNAGHWARNYREYDSIIGPKFTSNVGNETHAPNALASNVIRNVALHLGRRDSDWNRAVTTTIYKLHRVLGIDMNDPRTTLDIEYCGPFQATAPTQHEDTAAAPIHVWALLGITLLLPMGFFYLPHKAWVFLGIPYFGFGLFCAAIKWWPWHARLHVPVLCLFAVVLAGFCCTRIGKFISVFLVAGLVLALRPLAGNAEPKALLSKRGIFQRDRLSVMFELQPSLKEPTRAVAEQAAAYNPEIIGLAGFGSKWEYPLERLILDQTKERPYFTTFFTTRPDSRSDREGTYHAPDVVIAMDAPQATMADPHTGKKYLAVQQWLPFTLYLPEDRVCRADIDPAKLAFIGWYANQGWGPLEGPYPDWSLPVICWGFAPSSRLLYESDGQPMKLVMECRRNECPDQVMTIKVNGDVVHRRTFDPDTQEFIHVEVPVQGKAGLTQVDFEYSRDEVKYHRHLGVMFRQLKVVPLAHGDPANDRLGALWEAPLRGNGIPLQLDGDIGNGR